MMHASCTKPEEVGGVILVPGCQATEALEPGEQPLDLPAPPIATERPTVVILRVTRFPAPALPKW